MIFDAHSDLGAYFVNERAWQEKAVMTELLEEYKRNDVKGVISAIFLENNQVASAKEEALNQLATLKIIAKNNPEIALVSTFKEYEEAKKRNQTGIFLSLEGAEPVSSPMQLSLFKDMGVRFIGLTWIRRNRFADGAEARDFLQKGGLTPEGVALIKTMEEEKMILDLSHLCDEGIKDVFLHYKGALFSSHTNARKINNIPRNHPDEVLKEISDRGGVVGLNIANFIVNNERDATTEDLTNHLKHMVNVCGEEGVVLGLDLCSKLFDHPFVKEEASDVLADYDDTTKYLEELQSTFSDDFIEAFSHKNMERFLKENL